MWGQTHLLKHPPQQGQWVHVSLEGIVRAVCSSTDLLMCKHTATVLISMEAP